MSCPPLQLQRPGIEDERVVAAMQQCQVKHVEWIDRTNARNQRWFAMTVQRLQGKTAGIDLAAFFHELGDLLVEVLMTGKRFVAQGREVALDTQGNAGTVQQDRGVEALALQAGGLQQIDETD